MDMFHVALSVLALAGLGGCVWLIIERGRGLAARATLSAERDAAQDARRAAEARVAEGQGELTRLDARVDELEIESARLHEQLASRERSAKQAAEEAKLREDQRRAEDERRLAELHERYQNAFQSLAAKTLDESNKKFMERAQEAFRAHDERTQEVFAAKHKSMSELVNPINEALRKQEERLGQIDKDRVKSRAELDQQLRMLSEQAIGLGEQTQQLVRSLKAPHVRGRWGEIQLRRVVELAGMSAHCDFDEQTSVQAGEDEAASLRRPDMVVRLPGERCIVVDAKASLANYLEAIEADTDERKADRLRAHARSLRLRVDDLASKAYQTRMAEVGLSPDFAVLFVPGDQFLSAALLEEPGLLEHAASKNVILTTPATLIALLKAVSFGWAQASLADDAREILKLGTELHDRVSVMAEHLGKVGLNIGRTVEAYNKAVGSLESRVLPSARKIADFPAVQTTKRVERLEQAVTEPKRLTPPEAPAQTQPQAKPEAEPKAEPKSEPKELAAGKPSAAGGGPIGTDPDSDPQGRLLGG